MTAYVTATLQQLLLRRFARPAGARASQLRVQAPAQVHAPDVAETLPILFRSEGFAEDLFDSHSSH